MGTDERMENINGEMGDRSTPQKSGRYLVTYQAGPFGRQVRQADRTEYPKGNWHWVLLPGCNSVLERDIIAWQKCPEPYTGDLK